MILMVHLLIFIRLIIHFFIGLVIFAWRKNLGSAKSNLIWQFVSRFIYTNLVLRKSVFNAFLLITTSPPQQLLLLCVHNSWLHVIGFFISLQFQGCRSLNSFVQRELETRRMQHLQKLSFKFLGSRTWHVLSIFACFSLLPDNLESTHCEG